MAPQEGEGPGGAGADGAAPDDAGAGAGRRSASPWRAWSTRPAIADAATSSSSASRVTRREAKVRRAGGEDVT